LTGYQLPARGWACRSTLLRLKQFLGKGDKRFDIQDNGQCLHQTERFIYLGGTISSNEGSGADVSRRIRIARGIFHALSKVWTSKDTKKSTKIEVFEILVLNSFSCNSETWCTKAVSKHKIQVFEMACLRKVEGVTKRDKLRNSEIQRRLKWKHDVIQRIQQRHLKFFGHVVRISNDRFPYSYEWICSLNEKPRETEETMD